MSDKAKIRRRQSSPLFATLTNRKHMWPIVCLRGNGIGLFGIKNYHIDVYRAVQCCFYVDVAKVTPPRITRLGGYGSPLRWAP